MTDWLKESAASQGRAIAAGTLDAVDLTEAYLEAIDGHELTSRIYARITPDRARAEAKAAAERARLGLRRGPLDGVPISWKDLFDTAGVATEAGSKLLEGRVPVQDAEVLSRATSHGLVCLGKTHMTELAFSGLGLNPVTASPPSVNFPDCVSGGSSSGAATSTAFGLAAAGIGSDTGGSVRVPAAWNDLVGLKTTSGRLPLTGVVPLAARFDTVGPLARTVEDAALLLAAMEEGVAPDLRGATLSGKRFAVLKTSAQEDLREIPAQGFSRAIAALEATGASLVDIEVPAVAEALSMSGILFASEAYGTWKDVIEANPEVMFAEVRERFRSGRDHSAADYVSAWQKLEELRAAYLSATASFDAVLVPTAPNMPPQIERLLNDSDYFVAENLLALRNTRIGNVMGLCALTLPTGVPSAGLMALAAPGAEDRLLRLGAAAEVALSA